MLCVLIDNHWGKQIHFNCRRILTYTHTSARENILKYVNMRNVHTYVYIHVQLVTVVLLFTAAIKVVFTHQHQFSPIAHRHLHTNGLCLSSSAAGVVITAAATVMLNPKQVDKNHKLHLMLVPERKWHEKVKRVSSEGISSTTQSAQQCDILFESRQQSANCLCLTATHTHTHTRTITHTHTHDMQI